MRTLGVAILIAGSSAAHAEGALFEADAGIAAPVGDDSYDRNVDNSFKLGARLGTRTSFGALDLGVDFTPYSDNLSNALIDVDIQRFRFLFGARWNHPISPKAHVFVRGAAGLDLIHYHASGTVLGITVDQSETDSGIGFEIDTGILFDVGKVQVGAKLGIPLGFHFNGDDPNDPADADLDYTAVDVDFAFVLNVPL